MDIVVDHVIHVVKDPHGTRRDFEDALGWHTVRGGEHPMWGTHNTLAYFGLFYIEWIGVTNETIASQSEFGQNVLRGLEQGEGVIQFALRTRDMDSIAESWRRQGIAFDGPFPAQRARPDGSLVRWRMLFPEQVQNQFLIPFVIEWDEPDVVRKADLAARGALLPEALGPLPRVLHVVVEELEHVTHRFEQYFEVLPHLTQNPVFGRGVFYTIDDTTICFWEARAEVQQSQNSRERVVQIDFLDDGTQSDIEHHLRTVSPSMLMLHGLQVNLGRTNSKTE